MNTQSNPIKVANTHWAERDRKAYETVAKLVPQVFESSLKLWQWRFDNKPERPWQAHIYLYPVTALRYTIRSSDGAYAPVEPREELTFLIAANSYREATNRVAAEVEHHGYKPNEWVCYVQAAILVPIAEDR
jgi:hypothetical protein